VTRPLLLLWDIDGTLLQRASREHADALRRALAQVHGELQLDGHEIEAAGRTDGAIARDLLVAAGLAPPAIDARADDVIATCCALYDELCPADLRPRLAPGVPEALARLGERPEAYRFSLVTGNYERVARLKLARAGIGDWFAEGQGGFGSDAEERERLPPIARGRAGGWPRERTVVIGDTPRDIACARADGLRVIAVATGPYAVEALADADAVADSAEAVVAVLEDWA
jgi:phosphoglycolate phosphatase-like HAD superfamily hydrolase